MKNLTQLALIFAFIFLTSYSFAQLSLKGGYNLTNLHSSEIESEHLKNIPGFHFGATYAFPISDAFAIETGAILTTKGTKVSMSDTWEGQTYEAETKVNFLYTDIPLLAKVSFAAGNSNIYLAVGPYVGIGLWGISRYTETENGITSDTEEEDITFGSEEDDVKRLEAGISAGAGIELNSFLIGVYYHHGLSNIGNYEDDTIMNRVLGFSVGVKFGGK